MSFDRLHFLSNEMTVSLT